jgi:hypothetical protein
MKHKKVNIKKILNKKYKGGEETLDLIDRAIIEKEKQKNPEKEKDIEEVENLLLKYEEDLNVAQFYMDQLEDFADEFKWLLDWTQWFLKV